MRNMFLAGAAMAAVATPAFAQVSAPFTGPHVEALAGYDALGAGNDNLDNAKDGFLYGVNVGYDFQLGGVIAGIEGEFTDSTTTANASDIDVLGDSTQLETDRDLYIGARLGFAVAPSTMIYAKGGYTNAKIKARYNDGAGLTLNDSSTLDGYRVGAGIEQKFNLFGPSGFVKAEYRYSNYKNLDYGNADLRTNIDRHQVLAGVGVRF